MTLRSWIGSLSRLRRSAWGAVALSGVLVLAGLGYSASRAATPERAAQTGAAKQAPTIVTPSTQRHRVIAYYLHTTYRCATCRKIEAYSREAIESAFPQELKDGRLVWQVVNFEEKGNTHFVKDFQLYTKSLVLVDEVKGKQVRWKNLTKVWELLRDKEAFLSYVQGETRSYLTGKS